MHFAHFGKLVHNNLEIYPVDIQVGIHCN